MLLFVKPDKWYLGYNDHDDNDYVFFGPLEFVIIYVSVNSQRLKQLTKRQVDLNFENLVQRYQAKQKKLEELAFKAK
jgi:hypothetical protein